MFQYFEYLKKTRTKVCMYIFKNVTQVYMLLFLNGFSKIMFQTLK